MSEAPHNPKLFELASEEVVVPLQVTQAGHTYRVCHRLRPPKPDDWYTYEATLQPAVEELGDPAEPSFRLILQASEAALGLWTRLIRCVDGYALPAEPAVQDGALTHEEGRAGQGFSPDKNNAARSRSEAEIPLVPSDSEGRFMRDATLEGARGNPPRGFPDDSGTDWRELIPLAHKEAAVRALTLVAPAQADAAGSSGFFPLAAEEVRVVLEAAANGAAYPRLAHRFRPPTVEAERRYRRLLADNVIVRGGRTPRTLLPARLPALTRLYDQLILGVEGYAINGRPPASRNQLLEHMDAWHKRVAVEALFGGLVAEAPVAETNPLVVSGVEP